MLPHSSPPRFPLFRKRRAFRQLQDLFPLPALRRHSLLVAQSGAGKSELLKCLLLRLSLDQRHWWQRPQPTKKRSVILLDPHGDLAHECAQLHEFAPFESRSGIRSPIAYLSPRFAGNRDLVLNPFDLHGEKPLKQEAEVLAQQLTNVFLSMLSTGNVQLSFQMKTVLVPIFTTLFLLNKFSAEPPTFHDVERFLDDQRNQDLLNFALEHGTTAHQRFFRDIYGEKRLSSTKFALQVRLLSLLNHSGFTKTLAQPRSTWNLRAMIDQGSTILIDTSRITLGKEVADLFGRTIVALTQSYAFLRRKGRKMPTFVLIDEAPSFVGEDLKTGLSEARKFGLHYVLVQQVLEQGNFSTEFRKAVLGNTALKIMGKAGHSTQAALGRECGLEQKDFSGLQTGEFIIKPDSRNAFRAHIPPYWLAKRGRMSSEDWLFQRQIQLQLYTSPPKPSRDVEAEAAFGQRMPIFWQV